MITLDFYTLDVFTTKRLSGNPVAVVIGADGLSGAQMQAIAAEFNLSETVFAMAPNDAANTAKVRIFTPAREMPFAGHPTIGTAVLLAQLPGDKTADIVLEEVVGPVHVAVSNNALHGELTASVLPTEKTTAPALNDIAAALSIVTEEIGFGNHRPTVFDAGNQFLFVPIKSRATLAKAQADLSNWSRLNGTDGIGAYLYCPSTEIGIDFQCRMFGPLAGVIEDPATGSAAATFPGPMMKVSSLGDGSHRWCLVQGEDMGRRSVINVSADIDNGTLQAVRVGGNAVRVQAGQITIDAADAHAGDVWNG